MIDYGMGKTNRNTETGVRFGFIALNSLHPDLWDDLWSLDNPTLDVALGNYCRDYLSNLAKHGKLDASAMDIEEADDIGEAIAELSDEEAKDLLDQIDTWSLEAFWEGCDMELSGAEGTIDGVHVRVTELGGAYHMFVFASRFTGRYAECSPCVPGAGDLASPNPDGPLTYDVHPDWRDI